MVFANKQFRYYNLQYSNCLIPQNVTLLYVGIPILRLISKSPKQAKVAKDSRYDPKNNIFVRCSYGSQK